MTRPQVWSSVGIAFTRVADADADTGCCFLRTFSIRRGTRVGERGRQLALAWQGAVARNTYVRESACYIRGYRIYTYTRTRKNEPFFLILIFLFRFLFFLFFLFSPTLVISRFRFLCLSFYSRLKFLSWYYIFRYTYIL